ncbi:hypothetical protein D3C74_248360 [compost metagenome]
MRQVDERLEQPLKEVAPELIQHQCQNDRYRKVDKQVQRKQDHRVFQNDHKIRLGKQPSEMLQTDPFAASDAVIRLIILKGNDQPVHREILEDDEIQHAGQ